MSDAEEKKSGYRLEYAKNNRAKCKGVLDPFLFSCYLPSFSSMYAFYNPSGPKPCNG